MSDFWKTILAFLCGGGGLALINVIQDRWKYRQDRKAVKEDRAEERKDQMGELNKKLDLFIETQQKFNQEMSDRLKETDEQMAVQSEALKLILLNWILSLGQKYILAGFVSFDDRKRLRDMYNVYHVGLRGNGDADFIMNAVDELPLSK